jgi:ABC-type multidrug transport system fused ATPase/permease subunit
MALALPLADSFGAAAAAALTLSASAAAPAAPAPPPWTAPAALVQMGALASAGVLLAAAPYVLKRLAKVEAEVAFARTWPRTARASFSTALAALLAACSAALVASSLLGAAPDVPQLLLAGALLANALALLLRAVRRDAPPDFLCVFAASAAAFAAGRGAQQGVFGAGAATLPLVALVATAAVAGGALCVVLAAPWAAALVAAAAPASAPVAAGATTSAVEDRERLLLPGGEEGVGEGEGQEAPPADSSVADVPGARGAALSPIDDASFAARLVFAWLSPLLTTGSRRALESSDLPPVPQAETCTAVRATFARAWAAELARARPASGVPRLGLVLVRAFAGLALSATLFKLSFDVVQATGPLLLGAIIALLEQLASQPAAAAGGWRGAAVSGAFYASLFFASNSLQTLMLHHYFADTYRLGLELRNAVMVAVFEKAARLSVGGADGGGNGAAPAAASGAPLAAAETAGSTPRAPPTPAATARGGGSAAAAASESSPVNLLSTDAKRLQDITTYIVITVSGPFQIILYTYLLYLQLGPSTLGGVAVIVGVLPLNALVARTSKRLQRAVMTAKDARIKATQEALAGIRLVKLNAWEEPFAERIAELRAAEIATLRSYQYLQAFASILWQGVPIITAVATYSTFVLTGGRLSPAAVFSSLALFNLLRFPMGMLPSVLNNLVEAQVSVGRLQAFLERSEVAPDAVTRLPASGATSGALAAAPEGMPNDAAVFLRGADFAWNVEAPAAVLADVNLVVPLGQLVAVCGSVGAGKSLLLHAVLGECARLTGACAVRGRVAYAAQQPFILNATVRENIVLFSDGFDESRYRAALRACQLEADLAILPAGDQTEIGERGINLSGGQKARVSLARAVYAEADVVLLDDVLSAVDAHVASAIFSGVCLALRDSGRAVLLVTHGLQFLARCDAVVVLDRGRVVAQGPAAQVLAEARADGGGALAQMLRSHDREGVDVLTRATSAAAHDGSGTTGEPVRSAQPAFVAIAVAAKGVPSGGGTAVSSGGGGTGGGSGSIGGGGSGGSNGGGSGGFAGSVGVMEAIRNLAFGRQTTAESRVRGFVDLSVYLAYTRAAGGPAAVAVLLVLWAAFYAASLGSTFWLSFWSSRADLPVAVGLGVYAGMALGSLVVLLAVRLLWANAGLRASRRLHDALVRSLLHLPLSFFDSTPLGRTLNRVSSDVYACDESLPNSLQSFVSTLFSVLGSFVVTGLVTPVFLAAILPVSLLYVLLQRFFTRSSRELQRLESASRSPVFAHFSETLAGLVSIRAFRRAPHFVAKHAALTDKNSGAFWCNVSSNRWLGVRVETLSSLLTAAFTFVSVASAPGAGAAFASFAGLSLATIVGVTQSLNWLVRTSSDVQTQIVSVERINEYATLPPEAETDAAAGEPLDVPDAWPQAGAVRFHELGLVYRPNTPAALTGFSLDVRGGERVGVCGRTGAGKSSLLAALFRTADLQTGLVEIDGLDVKRVPLSVLRRRLTFVPQDALLFAGTVRRNLDVLGAHADAEVLAALEAVGMREAVERLGGLGAAVAEGGASFSSGERQLLTVARALLRRSKIVVLDEATASTDAATDARVQRALRAAFAGSTCLTVAHRINTIMDVDKVAVLGGGRLLEQGAPQELLRKRDSAFAALVGESQAATGGGDGGGGGGGAATAAVAEAH